MEKTAQQQLHDLWYKMKGEGNCTEYVSEMLTQLELLGTETNSLTRQSIHDKMESTLNKIKKAL